MGGALLVFIEKLAVTKDKIGNESELNTNFIRKKLTFLYKSKASV